MLLLSVTRHMPPMTLCPAPSVSEGLLRRHISNMQADCVILSFLIPNCEWLGFVSFINIIKYITK